MDRRRLHERRLPSHAGLPVGLRATSAAVRSCPASHVAGMVVAGEYGRRVVREPGALPAYVGSAMADNETDPDKQWFKELRLGGAIAAAGLLFEGAAALAGWRPHLVVHVGAWAVVGTGTAFLVRVLGQRYLD